MLQSRSFCQAVQSEAVKARESFERKQIEDLHIYQKNTDMIKMEAAIKSGYTMAGIYGTFSLLLLSQAWYFTGTIQAVPIAHYVYKAYLTNKRGNSFVRGVELNKDFSTAKFYYGFKVKHVEMDIDKISPKKIVRKEKFPNRSKFKIYIDLDLKGTELQIILDELYCNIPDTDLLNAVLRGDKGFVQENYVYQDACTYSDKEYLDFKKEMDYMKQDDTTVSEQIEENADFSRNVLDGKIESSSETEEENAKSTLENK